MSDGVGSKDATLALTVNGEHVSVGSDENTPLMYVLRNELGLKGVRAGCTVGECGSCTVWVGGAPRRSCLAPVGELAGAEVVTPEGLGTPEAPHPVQRAFLDEQAAQCGYCINGMIMTVASEVERGGCSDRQSASSALAEHICRCGTHGRILRAAVRAAGGDLPEPPNRTIVERADPADDAPLPDAVATNARVARWLRLTTDGTVVLLTPKVEIGQGILEALRRVVAAQLRLPIERIVTAAPATSDAVDLGHTAGSNSVDQGGVALGYASVALRRLIREGSARLLGVSPDDVRVGPEGASAGDRTIPLGDLAADGPLDGDILASDVPDWSLEQLTEPTLREDLKAKLTGAPAYLQDLELAGMRHVRALLPPTYESEPVELPDLEQFAETAGIDRVLRDGRLLLVVAEHEIDAIRGVTRLAREVRWRSPDAVDHGDVTTMLRSLPAEPFEAVRDAEAERAVEADGTLRATYSKPYEAHAPMSPSVGLAVVEDDLLKIWSHTQSPFPLRKELAALFGEDEERIVIEHVAGPGCYGMTGSDDAAALAALAARAMPGTPVRYQHSIDDEFGWDLYGSAMVADVAATLDESGRIAAWHNRTRTDTHYARPDGSGERLFVGWLREDGIPRSWSGPMEGGARDTIPYYDIPAIDAVADHVRGPLRTGSLRSLGSYFNVFVVESFMDELAERAGKDPVAFRLEHLTDERARRVVELAAEQAGWESHVGPSGRGMGFGFTRYKASKAYAAQVVEVGLDPEDGSFQVERIVVVADAGPSIDADGLRNQLEGGTLQSLSRAMFEELHLSGGTVRERDMASYPVLRFGDVPPIEVTLVERPDVEPLGAGESGTPALAAALANAIDDAVGIRLRDLPLTPARMEARLLDMDETEMARVRI